MKRERVNVNLYPWSLAVKGPFARRCEKDICSTFGIGRGTRGPWLFKLRCWSEEHDQDDLAMVRTCLIHYFQLLNPITFSEALARLLFSRESSTKIPERSGYEKVPRCLCCFAVINWVWREVEWLLTRHKTKYAVFACVNAFITLRILNFYDFWYL